MKYTIYTDGAYSKQHDEGAFAYVILNDENAEIERNAYKITKETNNRAELKAVIAAFNRLPDDADEVDIYSDSQYALNTLSGQWKHSNNDDLFKVWQKVRDEHKNIKHITYNWVKGHNGNVYNEICDQLCNDVLGYDANAEFEKQGEQKPAAWSEEDDRIYYSILADIRIRQDGSTSTLEAYYNEKIDWLKSLKERIGG